MENTNFYMWPKAATIVWSGTTWYDTERHDLVEKKDWKINNLKEQIAENEVLVDNLYKYTIKTMDNLAKLKEQLKELEK